MPNTYQENPALADPDIKAAHDEWLDSLEAWKDYKAERDEALRHRVHDKPYSEQPEVIAEIERTQANLDLILKERDELAAKLKALLEEFYRRDS